MSTLPDLERRILSVHCSINLRPTLDQIRELGELLAEAKSRIPHGQFSAFVRRVGIGQRSAQQFMQLANANLDSLSLDGLTLKRFLGIVQASRRPPLDESPEDDQGTAPTAEIQHADAREFLWPGRADVVVADPPWADLSHYDWLGIWLPSVLEDGGVALVQCGTSHLADVLLRLQAGRMIYRWTLAIVYQDADRGKPIGGFVPVWRPVIVLSHGKTRKIKPMNDVFTVQKEAKRHHKWEQPEGPWRHWLPRIVPSGTVFDPFAGSGTIAVVCRSLGFHSVSTDIDEGAVRIARRRVAASCPAGGSPP